MARPQEFDTAQALRSAMRVFWSKGYEATSVADILAATGLSKSSLYATFGDKRALFLAAFDSYQKERMTHLHQILNDGQPARLSIERFLREVVNHIGEPDHQCANMTASEAIELAPHDADVQKRVSDDFREVEDAFTRAIERGQADGSIANGENARKLARFLVVGLGGLEVMARAKSERARLDDSVAVMIESLA